MSNDEDRGQRAEAGRAFESIGSWRAYLVDTSARILFFVPPIAVWEALAAGMDAGEIGRSRGMAVAVNLVAGRLHGKVREGVGRVTRTTQESSKARVGAADTVSGMIVGVLTYCPVLYLSGASLEEGMVALPGALAFLTFAGRPFGAWQDWWRSRWRTTPVFRERR